jgi:hypothetical protein
VKALEYADTIALPDERIAVCGDWHSNKYGPVIQHCKLGFRGI